MRRLAPLALALLIQPGCGGPPPLPPNPASDNREAEVKEADDGMLKRAQQINSGKGR